MSACVMATSSTDITPPLTSILIVSYQTGSALFDCLSACLLQDGRFEIILADNGNPPATLSALQALTEHEPRLQILTGHGNIGFAAAVNLAAAQATGDHLWLLNPDTLPAPDTLAQLCEAARQAIPPFLIGVAIRNEDGTEQRGSRRELLTPKLALVEALRLHKIGLARLNHHTATPPQGLIRMPAISGASMFLRRQDFIEIGGMDADYFLHFEDLDFCWRFSRAGGHIYYAGSIDLPHVGGSSAVNRLTIERYKADSAILYFRKHFSDNKLLLPLVRLAIRARYAFIALIEKTARRHA